jgi:hypothetical protein
VATPGVDFFRVDRSASTRRLLVTAAFLVAAGATAIGAHLVHRIAPEVGHLVSLLGGLATMTGLVLGFGTMAMMLFENVYLAIEKERVCVHENGKDVAIAWDDLAGVAVEENVIVLRRGKGEPVRFPAGKSARDVARRIEEAKRKAAHGLLDPSSIS